MPPVHRPQFMVIELALGLAFLQKQLVEEIPVKSARPSVLLARLLQRSEGRVVDAKGGESFIPAGVTVKADDLAGVLRIEGSSEGVSELRRVVDLFDVRPAKISAEIHILLPLDKYEGSFKAELTNNHPLVLSDGHFRFGLDLTGRVNADGSLTAILEFSQPDSSFRAVHRMQNGETLFVRGMTPLEILSRSDDQVPAAHEWPSAKQPPQATEVPLEKRTILRIKLKIIEPAEKGGSKSLP